MHRPTQSVIWNARTHTDTHAPYSPLPQPAPAPPPDPVILLSPLRLITPCPPICRSSAALHLFPPSACLPAGRLSVDVKVGGLVSNSPSDTAPLTFHCTLSTEGISPPPHLCLFSSSVTAACILGAPTWTEKWRWGLLCAVMTQSVRLWPAWFPRRPASLEADSGQTCYLLPETPLRKLSGGITATRRLPCSSSPCTLPSLFTTSLHSNTSGIHHTLMSCKDGNAEGNLYSERIPPLKKLHGLEYLLDLLEIESLSCISFHSNIEHVTIEDEGGQRNNKK